MSEGAAWGLGLPWWSCSQVCYILPAPPACSPARTWQHMCTVSAGLSLQDRWQKEAFCVWSAPCKDGAPAVLCTDVESCMSLSLSSRFRSCTPQGPGTGLPPHLSCSGTVSVASSPLTLTCSMRSTFPRPSPCRTGRSRRRTRARALCSSGTPSSRWSSTASPSGRRPTEPFLIATW